MKSWCTLFILALMFPLMTHAVEQNDLRKLVKINASDFFVVTRDKGAYVSFDIPEVAEPASLILSLFLEGGEGFGEISEFLIYPVDRVTGQVGSRGIAITVDTQVDNFVDFVLPASFLKQVEHPIGFVIRTSQDTSFIFKGADDIGTVHDPRVLIEEREPDQIREFQIDSNFQSRMEKKINEIHTNTTPRWWEHTWVQLIMLLGAILGTVSLFGFRVGVADFFK